MGLVRVLVLLVPGLLLSPFAAAGGMATLPPIVWKSIPYGSKRLAEMAA